MFRENKEGLMLMKRCLKCLRIYFKQHIENMNILKNIYNEIFSCRKKRTKFGIGINFNDGYVFFLIHLGIMK